MNSGSTGATGRYSVSSILATMKFGPSDARASVTAASRSSKSDTVLVRVIPQLRATCSRSVPVPVWLVCPPVWPHCSLSQTTTVRFLGFSRPIDAIAPRFMSSDPSPSRDMTCSSVAMAIPRAMDEQRPMLP